MKKYIIGYLNFYNSLGDITIYCVKANSIKEAILNTIEKKFPEAKDYIPESLGDIKNYYSDMEASIEVIECPEEFEVIE
jgi:hypothetical protein